MNYLIEEIKYGQIYCMCDFRVISIKYFDSYNHKWLTNVDLEGCLNIHITDKDIFDYVISNDFDDDDEKNTYYEKSKISSFNKISLEEYDDIFFTFEKANKEDKGLIRLLIHITRNLYEDLDEEIKKYLGKYIDQIDIPISDIEIEYLEENKK